MNLKNVKRLLATETFKQSTVTFTGTFINGILGIFFFVFAARFLGPSDFALLTISIATITLIADIADLGVDTGLVRYVSKYSKSKPKKSLKYLKLAFEIKIFVGIAIVVVGYMLSGLLADVVFNKPELFLPLRLSFVGVLGALLFSFTTHTLQAYQKFVSWSAVLITTNGIRLALLFVMFTYALLNIGTALIIYISMPILGFLVGLFIIPYFFNAKHSKKVRSDFFHYNKWVAAMTAVAAASSRLDVFISARLLPLDQVGIYSAANQLVQVVPQLVAAFGTVIAPKMASMDTKRKFIDYLKKTQALVGGISLLGLFGIPVAVFVIPILYGAEFTAAIPIFSVLLIAMLIFLFSVPFHNAVFYYFAYPRLFFYIAIGHLVIIATSGWYLIGEYGAMGAAFAVLLGSLFNFVVPASWVIYKLSKE